MAVSGWWTRPLGLSLPSIVLMVQRADSDGRFVCFGSKCPLAQILNRCRPTFGYGIRQIVFPVFFNLPGP